jgi:HK97 family phage prohead protease
MKYKQLFIKQLDAPQAGDEEKYIIRGVFSTGSPDRQGDIVVQNGWDVKEFLLNPVVLWAHDHWQFAVAKVIELGFNAEGNLSGAIQFAAEENPASMILYKLYKGGYMRAFSAGFDSIDGGYDKVNDVTVLTRNILYEISCVNVPANAEALALQAGIDMSPLKKFAEDSLAKRKLYHSKGPACRTADETVSECVSRKIGELVDEGYEQDQAEAIAYSVCDKACDKSIDSDKTKCEIKESLGRIESAIGDIKSLTANKKDGRQPSKEGKKILVKSINKAIRSLLSEKRNIKDN